MPAPPPATTPRLRPKVPKLRASCDGCGTAKVKCDQGHPKCSRCVALGVDCVYGLSRKNGKAPRKRLGADLVGTQQKHQRTSWTAESSDHGKMTGFGEVQSSNEHASADVSDPLVGILPAPAIDAQNGADSDFPALTFDGWLELDGFGASLQTPSLLNFENEGTRGASLHSTESHVCSWDSYEIFRDLICPSPSVHAPDSNSVTVSAQLDHVLHFNRTAIDRLGRLLKCPCSKLGHRVMVHASIVSRILIWYQQAAGWPCITPGSPQLSGRTESPSPPTTPSETGSGSDTTDSSPIVRATGFAVEHVPVTVGSFSIEDQNIRVALRIQLVLSELKKAAKLIDTFTSQESDKTSHGGGVSLSSQLGVWLRSEHSRTVGILKSRLCTINEALCS